MDVIHPMFFCLDPLNNFVISDCMFHSIRVFSPEGNLLHTIGRERHQQRMVLYSTGVAVTPNGRLVCVSEKRTTVYEYFNSYLLRVVNKCKLEGKLSIINAMNDQSVLYYV